MVTKITGLVTKKHGGRPGDERKSEKSQRIGRKELGEKKKKEIKELEARCREVEVPRGSCSKTGKLIFHFMYITLSHKNLELPNSRI